MAVGANCIWELRTTGNDANNGGGFVRGATGTDFSQQPNAQKSIDLVTNTAIVHTTTTQVQFATYVPLAEDVGNILVINGGTATAGRYQITTIDAVNKRWTVDRALGTAGQTIAGGMGGCLASIGTLGAAVNQGLANQHAYIGPGTYTLTTTTPNISGGPYSNASNITCMIIGYNTSRTDIVFGTGPVMNVGSLNTFTVFDLNNATASGLAICNIAVNGNGNAAVIAFDATTNNHLLICHALAATTGFLQSGTNVFPLYCKATNCTTGFSAGGAGLGGYRCWADGCTTGFSVSATVRIYCDCMATDCTTGFSTVASSAGQLAVGCTVEGNSGDGLNFLGAGSAAIGCAITNNNIGLDLGGGAAGFDLGCAFFGNGTNVQTTVPSQTVRIGEITLTGDPWESAGSDDYRANAIAGAGASIRGTSVPIPGQIDKNDIGAVQSVGGVDVSADVAAIKAKTDNLPASPAAVGSPMTLTAGERDAVATALLDLANGVELSTTMREALRLILSAVAGKLSGAAGPVTTIRDVNDVKDRIVSTVDATGRTSVTLDAT